MNKFISHLYFLLASLLMCLFFITSCEKKTEKKEAAVPETGTVKDIEGNVYNTVKIGKQWWMAEDLRTIRFQDSSSILLINVDKSATVNSADKNWSECNTAAYCENIDNNNKKLGKFYNWYAVNDLRKIAPKGWHIPTDEEWKELERSLEMSEEECDKSNWRGNNTADKLKVTSPLSWANYTGVWSNNESGFTALPNGCLMFQGYWGNPGIGATAFWWTSSAHSSSIGAWYRHLDYKTSKVFRYYGAKSYGFGIRCVKD